MATEGLIARFGGDEFLVICATGDDAERPQRLAAAILAAFGDAFRMAGEEFTITASIGIARAPDHGDRPQTLIQNADVAMSASSDSIVVDVNSEQDASLEDRVVVDFDIQGLAPV